MSKAQKNVLYLKMDRCNYKVNDIEKVVNFAQKEKGDNWEVFASDLPPNIPSKEKISYEFKVESFNKWLEKLKKKK